MNLKRSPGRPRKFDRAAALQQAVDLFWARGYEGVSLADLQVAMGGISAPSFYAAFKSKEALFKEAVALNLAMTGSESLKEMTRHPSARASIEGLLHASIQVCSMPGRPTGCLVVLGAINCSRPNRRIQEHLRLLRQRRPAVLRERLQRGIAEGDLPSDVNVEPMVAFYTTILGGLALQARDGASREELQAAVGMAMAAWDPFVASKGAFTSVPAPRKTP